MTQRFAGLPVAATLGLVLSFAAALAAYPANLRPSCASIDPSSLAESGQPERDAAAAAAMEAAQRAERSGEPACAAMLWHVLSRHRLDAGDFDGAWQAAERGEEAAIAAGEARLEAQALGDRGNVHFYRLEREEARADFEAALQRLGDRDDSRLRVALEQDLGITLSNLGDREQALPHLIRAVEIAERDLPSGPWPTLLSNLGAVYEAMDAAPVARTAYESALEIAERVADGGARADALTRLGALLMAEGRNREGLAALERAAGVQELETRGRAPVARAWTLGFLADAREANGDPQGAVRCHREALGLAESVGHDEIAAHHLAALARLVLEESAGRSRDLLDASHRHWIRSEPGRSGEANARIEWIEARWQWRWGSAEAGGAACDRALVALERQRDRLTVLDDRRRLLELSRDLYAECVESALAEGRTEPGAVERAYAWHARSRTEEWRSVAPSRRLSDPSRIDLPERSLPPTTAVLDFSLGAVSSFAFVRTGGERVAVPLAVGREELAARIDGFVELLAGARPEGWVPTGFALYEDLFAPVLERVGDGAERWIVIGEGPLGLLPFEALPTGPGAKAHFLLERFDFAYALSEADALDSLAAPAHRGLASDSTAALVVAPVGEAFEWNLDARPVRRLFAAQGLRDVPLPFASREARRLAAALDGSPIRLEGPDATEEAVKRALGSPLRLAHFATHGFASSWSESRSAIVLAPTAAEDGFLQPGELTSLRLDADLVTLAACQTALHRARLGDPARSLANAFRAAGARTVVAALWEIPDRASERLVAAFYDRLAAGRTRGEALREAKLAMLRAGRPAYEWAGLILLGDGSSTLSGIWRPEKRTPLVAATAAGLGAGGLALWILLRRRQRPR